MIEVTSRPNSSSTRSWHELAELVGQLDLATLEVDRAEPGRHDHVAERQGDDPAEQLGDLLGLDRGVGADDLAQEDLGVGDAHHAQAVGPHLDHLEVGVADGDRLRGPPAQVGDLADVEEVHLAAERAVEAVLPALQRAEDRAGSRLVSS